MYDSRRYSHRNHFRMQVDPVMLALLVGAVLLVCGIVIGHMATAVVSESAAELASQIVR